MRDYTANPVIVDRAVELWKRALAAPIYQNERPGEESDRSGMASMLATILPKNNTGDILEAFGAALKEALLDETRRSWERTCLSVDYHPDKMLGDAAEKSGLKMQFPWKTTMHIYEDTVCFSVGYGAPTEYHYPLSGGRWLITDLRGKDIAKVVALIEAGVDVGLEIEAAT